ncbi:MAG: fasciclin domain-containing protein [Verrucomicrobiota bacterium]
MKFRFRFVAVGLLAGLLALPAISAAKPAKSGKQKGPKSHDLADTIIANPILTNFARLLQACPDVYTFLSSRGPFIVFAPTDSAFAKLQPGELEALLRPENHERLQDILYFHIINGKRLDLKDLMPLRAIFSAQGNPLTFKTSHSGAQLVSKAKVVHADIHCANGNLNEIDTVLSPPEEALPKLSYVQTAPAGTTNAVTPVSPTGDTNAVDQPAPANPNPGTTPVAQPASGQ